MTAAEKINQIIADEWDTETDTWKKLVVIAYYMGAETEARSHGEKVNQILAAQRDRAGKCRYRNMAMYVQGDISYIYSPNYSGDITYTFGRDETNL